MDVPNLFHGQFFVQKRIYNLPVSIAQAVVFINLNGMHGHYIFSPEAFPYKYPT